AARLAGVVAEPPGDRRHRVVFGDGQVAVEEALVLDVVQVLLDLLAGRAGVVARRRFVPVDRPVEAEVPGGEQPLAFLLRRRGSHSRDRELQVRRDPGAAYRHEDSSAWRGQRATTWGAAGACAAPRFPAGGAPGGGRGPGGPAGGGPPRRARAAAATTARG